MSGGASDGVTHFKWNPELVSDGVSPYAFIGRKCDYCGAKNVRTDKCPSCGARERA